VSQTLILSAGCRPNHLYFLCCFLCCGFRPLPLPSRVSCVLSPPIIAYRRKKKVPQTNKTAYFFVTVFSFSFCSFHGNGVRSWSYFCVSRLKGNCFFFSLFICCCCCLLYSRVPRFLDLFFLSSLFVGVVWQRQMNERERERGGTRKDKRCGSF
jgi:hypothetical protein